ncbi:hypothetical protein HBB16_11735 [Pseudonocardia sp. MCCB 268]|nr:hypothetical protein [Pseudonocardia cytotoxica]
MANIGFWVELDEDGKRTETLVYPWRMRAARQLIGNPGVVLGRFPSTSCGPTASRSRRGRRRYLPRPGRVLGLR